MPCSSEVMGTGDRRERLACGGRIRLTGRNFQIINRIVYKESREYGVALKATQFARKTLRADNLRYQPGHSIYLEYPRYIAQQCWSKYAAGFTLHPRQSVSVPEF